MDLRPRIARNGSVGSDPSEKPRGEEAAEPFRNILNRSNKGCPASRPDVSGEGILLPCHCQSATVWEWCGAGAAGGTRRQAGRSWVVTVAGRPRTRRPPRRTTLGGGRQGQSRAHTSDEGSVNFFILLSTTVSRRGPRDGPGRACCDVALHPGLLFHFVLLCWAPRARRGKSKSATHLCCLLFLLSAALERERASHGH
jgi:hypothetical protein